MVLNPYSRGSGVGNIESERHVEVAQAGEFGPICVLFKPCDVLHGAVGLGDRIQGPSAAMARTGCGARYQQPVCLRLKRIGSHLQGIAGPTIGEANRAGAGERLVQAHRLEAAR